MKKRRILSVLLLGLSLGLLLAGCGPTPESCPECPACPECPTAEPCPDCPAAEPCPDCPECPEAECPGAGDPAAPGASFFEEWWAGSAHADVEAEAFTHWDEDDPTVVPADCAKCHSEGGYLDFLGVDGTAVRVVDNDHPVGTVVTCDACHNQATPTWDTVVFPSGAQITGLGPEARCMECHQGRASTQIVDDSIAEAGLQDMDTVSEDLGFTNIHYYAAAATMYGTLAQGGYEYPERAYDGKHDHVPGLDTCVGCHDMHTLALKTETCSDCHTEDDPRDRRMFGSLVDYDGDGDLEEGIYYEIEGLRDMLYKAIQAYGDEVSGAHIVYDPHAYPYFFVDTNANGQADEDEVTSPNAYNAWTGRLAKAAYNYQVSLKDPGTYAHGGKYIIQLLYDSSENLNEALSNPVDLSKANRIDHGHFAGSERAFRNWDEEGVVPRLCSRCHTKDGLPLYIAEGVEISQSPSNGLNCATCHDDLTTFSIYEVPWVRFPRGTLIDSGDPSSNLCLNCHQGRSSIATINGAIAGRDLDEVAEDLEFIDIHFFAAGATLYGTEVQGAYEYATDGYAGRLEHVETYRNCTQCHDIHRQDVLVGECGACHPGVETPEDLVNVRMSTIDYDGDGDTQEGIYGEIDTLRQALYVAIQAYAANTAATPIVYEPGTYPYFFTDTDGNGEVDEAEVAFSNRYAAWTPRLLRAAYNFQYAMKDPGAFAHNPQYILQILYDSIADLGGEVSGMVRPQGAP
jgi:hypothetical protein